MGKDFFYVSAEEHVMVLQEEAKQLEAENAQLKARIAELEAENEQINLHIQDIAEASENIRQKDLARAMFEAWGKEEN